MLAGIKQGTGTPAVPWGARRMTSSGVNLACMDAFHPAHLPLPRAVAPYAVTRVTSTMSLAAIASDGTPQIVVLGTFKSGSIQAVSNSATGAGGTVSSDARAYDEHWLSNFAFMVDSNSPIDFNTAWTTKLHTAITSNELSSPPALGASFVDALGGYAAATVVPSAFSVQVLNPQAVQNAAGFCYASRLQTQLDLGGITSAGTYQTLANQFVSFNAPRILAGGKLAFRGVKIDAVPYNMSELADFRHLGGMPEVISGGPLNGTAHYARRYINNAGFAPIILIRPAGAPALELLVCTEYRTRFAPANPAQASHRLHPCATDQHWNNLQRTMAAQGHGVLDIVEQVAQWGTRAAGVIGGARAAMEAVGAALG